MKYLLVVFLIAWSTAARAETIAIIDINTGDCSLAPASFSSSAIVVLWDSPGPMGVRFRVEPPVGSTIHAFATPYITIGSIDTDLSIAFGQCIDAVFDYFVIGTIFATWNPGTAWIMPSMGQVNVLKADCSFTEMPIVACGATIPDPASSSAACADCFCPCLDPVAVEPTTWGKVKSLYR